jgi:hypothetical protein
VDWVILTLVGVAVVVFVVFQRSKGIRPRSTRGLSRLSAAEILSRVQALRDTNAQWDTVWSRLNPSGDPEVQQLLIEIRGPNMFAPHLGLGVIADGCERVLASSPSADGLAALREAIRRAEPFVG